MKVVCMMLPVLLAILSLTEAGGGCRQVDKCPEKLSSGPDWVESCNEWNGRASLCVGMRMIPKPLPPRPPQ